MGLEWSSMSFRESEFAIDPLLSASSSLSYSRVTDSAIYSSCFLPSFLPSSVRMEKCGTTCINQQSQTGIQIQLILSGLQCFSESRNSQLIRFQWCLCLDDFISCFLTGLLRRCEANTEIIPFSFTRVQKRADSSSTEETDIQTYRHTDRQADRRESSERTQKKLYNHGRKEIHGTKEMIECKVKNKHPHTHTLKQKKEQAYSVALRSASDWAFNSIHCLWSASLSSINLRLDCESWRSKALCMPCNVERSCSCLLEKQREANNKTKGTRKDKREKIWNEHKNWNHKTEEEGKEEKGGRGDIYTKTTLDNSPLLCLRKGSVLTHQSILTTQRKGKHNTKKEQ